MVETDFSLNRFEGDAGRAADVYRGVTALTAADIADVVAFAVTRPAHVNLDEIVVRPVQQALGVQGGPERLRRAAPRTRLRAARRGRPHGKMPRSLVASATRWTATA